MEYSTLGSSGLRISRLCLGAMTFGAGTGIWGEIAGLDRAQAQQYRARFARTEAILAARLGDLVAGLDSIDAPFCRLFSWLLSNLRFCWCWMRDIAPTYRFCSAARRLRSILGRVRLRQRAFVTSRQ